MNFIIFLSVILLLKVAYNVSAINEILNSECGKVKIKLNYYFIIL